jgi:hypothetical protein
MVGHSVRRQGPGTAPSTARGPIEREHPFTADTMSADAGSSRSYYHQLRHACQLDVTQRLRQFHVPAKLVSYSASPGVNRLANDDPVSASSDCAFSRCSALVVLLVAAHREFAPTVFCKISLLEDPGCQIHTLAADAQHVAEEFLGQAEMIRSLAVSGHRLELYVIGHK